MATDAASFSFSYCLNTSTISGQKVPIAEEVTIAAEAGYQAIEPWIRELDAHAEAGHSLDDLRKQIADSGLVVPSAIGFFAWVVDDPIARQKGLEEAKRSMEQVRQIGGTRIAAPAAGATDTSGLDLRAIGDRYRDLLAIGRELGVIPEIEVWGFSKTLTRLADAAYVAISAGEPDACVLADVFHLHKGRSAFGGLRLLRGHHLPVFHMNDYPGSPPPETITDADRVYPGDGVAPLGDLFRDLRAIGFQGYLSLELFNREYWKQDPRLVARTGLEKMKAVVTSAPTG
jgi:sugar phosphate isomerase/epimerase